MAESENGTLTGTVAVKKTARHISIMIKASTVLLMLPKPMKRNDTCKLDKIFASYRLLLIDFITTKVRKLETVDVYCYSEFHTMQRSSDN